MITPFNYFSGATSSSQTILNYHSSWEIKAASPNFSCLLLIPSTLGLLWFFSLLSSMLLLFWTSFFNLEYSDLLAFEFGSLRLNYPRWTRRSLVFCDKCCSLTLRGCLPSTSNDTLLIVSLKLSHILSRSTSLSRPSKRFWRVTLYSSNLVKFRRRNL